MDKTLSLVDGRWRILLRGAWHVLCILLACLLFFAVWRQASAIDDVTEYILRPGQEALLAEELAVLNEKNNPYLTSGLAPFSAIIGGKNMTVFATDATFPLFHRVTLAHGVWFTEETNAVVIDTELAIALFFTEDAVGQSVTVQGRELQVAGVYRADHNLFQRMSLQERAPVFVPFAAGIPGAPEGPSYLYIKEKTANDPVRVSFASILKLDLDTKGGLLNRYQDTEMHEKEWTMAQMGRILWAGTAYVLAAFAVLFCLRQAKCFFAWRRVVLAQHSIITRKEALRQVLYPLIPAVLAVVLVVSAQFMPYLPDHFLPSDRRLFNFMYYLQYFAGEILSRRMRIQPQYYDNLFYNGSIILFALAGVVWVKAGRLANLLCRILDKRTRG